MEKRLRVIIENCPQNHSCPSVKICPVGALVQEGFQAPTVDAEKCIKCGKCEKHCPQHLPVRNYLEDVAAKFER